MIIYENTPAIETERLLLRRYAPADTDALFELLSDLQVNTFLPWFPLQALTEARAFMQERFLKYYDKPSAYRYALCLKEDDWPIDYIWLADDDSHDLGYALAGKWQGRGLATEAAKAVVKRIKRAGYPYITATHDVHNLQSGQVMKKLGMTYRYSYVEQWQPKDITVTFRMYQLDFCDPARQTYLKYWNLYDDHFVEQDV